MSFGARLDAALDARGALCVGIDPHPQLLRAWGFDEDVDGLERFSAACVSGFAGVAAVVKPQSAFFERFGARGVAALERTVADCRSAGALVLLDVKRGDIGSTMAAYAAAYLDPTSPLAADAMTVSPYLGVGALEPAFIAAAAHDAGVFVLALTSNPEGAQVQHARTADGPSVAQTVIDALAARNDGATPTGSVGVVVGATVDQPVDLDRLNGPILVPGIGTQGGSVADVQRLFGPVLRSVLPSMSREVLRAGPHAASLRAAVEQRAADFAFLRS